MCLSAEQLVPVSTHVLQENTTLALLVQFVTQDAPYVTEAYQLAVASHQSQQCVLHAKTMAQTITSRW